MMRLVNGLAKYSLLLSLSTISILNLILWSLLTLFGSQEASIKASIDFSILLLLFVGVIPLVIDSEIVFRVVGAI